jgi:hypothetical protein
LLLRIEVFPAITRRRLSWKHCDVVRCYQKL